jgi:hypothetical protein
MIDAIPVTCSACDEQRQYGDVRPCPLCGRVPTTRYLTLSVSTRSIATVTLDRIHEFFKHNWGMIALVAALTVGASVLHYFVAGWISFGVALGLSVAAFFIRDHARSKVKEITRVQ